LMRDAHVGTQKHAGAKPDHSHADEALAHG
jgi:hypothetical protein